MEVIPARQTAKKYRFKKGVKKRICSHDSTDLQVLSQEGLEEATLPAVPGSQDVAAEDAALGLFLLQIDALVTCH